MIKVTGFSDQLLENVDNELEDFIADHEIKRENIITIKFYAATDEIGHLYHYARLVYEVLSNDEILGGVQDIE